MPHPLLVYPTRQPKRRRVPSFDLREPDLLKCAWCDTPIWLMESVTDIHGRLIHREGCLEEYNDLTAPDGQPFDAEVR